MKRVKICGLSREQDIQAVNAVQPDFCGFIIHFPKSRRSISADRLRQLRAGLCDSVCPVGVFVDEPVESIAALLRERVISVAQLHGTEDRCYIQSLRRQTESPIWQAFQIRTEADVQRANDSLADLVLLDAGQGSGKTFDWTLLERITRPFGLAGGLRQENLPVALQTAAVLLDVSGGVETDGYKDPEKMKQFVEAVRKG